MPSVSHRGQAQQHAGDSATSFPPSIPQCGFLQGPTSPPHSPAPYITEHHNQNHSRNYRSLHPVKPRGMDMLALFLVITSVSHNIKFLRADAFAVHPTK